MDSIVYCLQQMPLQEIPSRHRESRPSATITVPCPEDPKPMSVILKNKLNRIRWGGAARLRLSATPWVGRIWFKTNMRQCMRKGQIPFRCIPMTKAQIPQERETKCSHSRKGISVCHAAKCLITRKGRNGMKQNVTAQSEPGANIVTPTTPKHSIDLNNISENVLQYSAV